MRLLDRLVSLGSRTAAGAAIRLPLRLLPANYVARVASGPMKGLRWRVGASVHGCWLGTYELAEQRYVERVVKSGMIAWDLGANSGVYTLLLSRLVGPAGSVYAFEPLPANCADLLHHVSLNHCDNVTVVIAAAAEHDGLKGFQAAYSRSMGALKDELAGMLVPTLSLDGLLQRHRLAVPDFVKMDVEGAEAEVLKGATKLLAGQRTRWVVSLHGRKQADECEQIFRDAGYVLSDVAGRRLDRSIADAEISDLVAAPQALEGFRLDPSAAE